MRRGPKPTKANVETKARLPKTEEERLQRPRSPV